MMSFRFLVWFLAIVSSLWIAPAAEPVRVLIIDGQCNHDWNATTAAITTQLKSSGLFSVKVATTPPANAGTAAWNAFSPDLAATDVVLLNYYGEDWPKAKLDALVGFVAKGGGLAAFHAGGSSFLGHVEYNRMIGLAWRPKEAGPSVALSKEGKLIRQERGQGSATGHGAREAFTVATRATDHPVMKGFPARWEHLADELYYSLRGPAENLEILATATSPISGLDEPMAWTVKYGKGRVFCTALGHDTVAIHSPGFQNLLARGTEWAARGKVSDAGLLKPLMATIKAHADPKVKVQGEYAAVKLPISKGVPIHSPTAVTVGPDRKMYVANYTGQILRLEDTDGDGLEDTSVLWADVTKDGKNYPYEDAVKYPGAPQKGGLRYPNAMVFKGRECYVATTQEIRIYEDRSNCGVADTSRTFATGWPFNMHYFDWTFGAQFGPDGWFYTMLCTDYINTAPAPDPLGLRGSVLRISPDGKKIERHAHGVRFAYGLAFNAEGDLFFTDNEGGGNATEELNLVVKNGNYGHHPKSPAGPPIDPLLRIASHTSATGMRFNATTNDFGGTAGDGFIAQWGPDGQWGSGGVVRVRLTKKPDGTYVAEQFPFSEGPAKTVDVCFGPQGDLYLARFGRDNNPGHLASDPPEGDIYRIIPTPGLDLGTAPQVARSNPLTERASGDPVNGRKLFEERTCNTCHTVDGSGTLNGLGPDLKHVWEAFRREGVLESIVDPGKSIATGYDTYIVETTDGQSLLGRILNSDESSVTLLMHGNQKRSLARKEIKAINIQPTSLMPAGLTTGFSEAQMDDLLAFIRSNGDSEAPGTVRLHAGSTLLKDGAGVSWGPDVAYAPGSYGYKGGGTFQLKDGSDPLAEFSRYGGGLEYRFNAPDGDYEVTVVMSEPYFHGAGQRVFSVLANGQVMAEDIDPFKEAGFGKTFRRTARVGVSGGKLVVSFAPKANEPLVNAIEVRKVK